ncbi:MULTISPECIES: hypothetical protein [Microvirga]|uniref:hypothetical protein n=1 Tax=Microvirga TaxID=186650 RepID=UPI0021C93B5C|nr:MULTISPECIES: hypothetical protein [unclassified Microvirga]
MNTLSSTLWPWLALAGLGAFHGLNPAMGWLFAVALGLHRQSRSLVVLALAPIAIGHAAAVGAVLLVTILFGTVLDATLLGRCAGILLLVWAGTHMLAGHRTPVRIGMQTGLAGLALWSFMMASAHGAGFMLIPALLSLCLSSGMAGELTASTSLPISVAALAVHTGAMLAVIGAVSLIVYDQGLAFLRRGWINLDIVWSAVLAGGGLLLLAT